MDKSGAESMPTTTESPPAWSAFPRENVRRGRNRDHERRRVRRVEHGETPFRAEAGRRRGHREAPHRNERRDLPCAHVAVFHRGAPPPVTRTRSQSQAKQQPAGGGLALLPFVPLRASWLPPRRPLS